MAIENRNLEPGTVLVTTYRKQKFACTVEEVEDGKKAYVLEDGRRFTSPSAAGSAVMGGVSCSGWRLWSVEGAGVASKEQRRTRSHTAATPPKRGAAPRPKDKVPSPLIKRAANQQDVGEGKARYFCTACTKPFEGPADELPTVCPEGHDSNDPQFATA